MTERKTVLISGASRGIGLLTARHLAHAGHKVYAGMRDLNGRNAEAAAELEAFARDRGADLLPIDLDVTAETACDAAVATPPSPSDETRLAEYGVLAAGRDRLLGVFGQLFETGKTPTHWQDARDLPTLLVEDLAAHAHQSTSWRLK